MVIFEVGEFDRKTRRNYIPLKGCMCIVAVLKVQCQIWTTPRLSGGSTNACAPLPLDFRMLPGSRRKVRRLCADAV
jgi:hypothetical protein